MTTHTRFESTYIFIRALLFTSAILTVALFILFTLRQAQERTREANVKSVVQQYSREALSHLKEGKIGEARESYKKATEIEPSSYNTYLMLGILDAGQGNFEKAQKSLETAIRLNPISEKAYYNLGNAYLCGGKLDQAIMNYRKSISLNEDYIAPRLMLALIYDALGRKTEAIDYYKGIARLENERQRMVLMDQSLPQDLRTRYQAQYDAATVFNEGFIAEKEGDDARAFHDYTRALTLNPECAGAYFRRGLIYYRKRDYSRAEKDIARALEINPRIMIAEGALGDLLLRQGRVGESRKIFERLAAAYPKNIVVKDYLGGLLMKEGHYEEAARIYRTIITLTPDYSHAHEGLGIACLNLRRYDEAEQSLRKAVSLSPAAPAPYYNLACLFSRRGNTKESLKYLKEALARGFDDRGLIRNDPDLDALRKDKAFSEIRP